MHSQNQHSGDVSTSHISMNVVEVGAEATESSVLVLLFKS